MEAATLTAAILVGMPAGARAEQSGASWLNAGPPASWNTAGMAIPEAPKASGPIDAKCRGLRRPAELDEDRSIGGRGWDLVGAYQGGWQMRVIRGTAAYDGMCRPRQYQDFVFVRGAFAGTLSPQPMDSRTDGALGRVSLQSGRLTADYVRYASDDPLCCPSRTTTVVFEVSGNPPVAKPVSTSATPAGTEESENAEAGARLSGTAWRLVRFEGGDGATFVPDDPAKYTLEFAAGGELFARIDCNRGRGTWQSSGQNQIALGPLALTRAHCGDASLHDQIVKQLDNIRSYVIRDGHLFLALIADGGTYEFEPGR
jgi:heat shock protein HslJ